MKGPKGPAEGTSSQKQREIAQQLDAKMPSDGSEVMEAQEAEASTLLPEAILKSTTGIELFKEIKGYYTEDPMFKAIVEMPTQFQKFQVINDLVYVNLEGKSLLCIPNISINEKNLHEIIILEAHSILAHLGAIKTLNYIRDYLWWKGMVSKIKAYCKTCVTCKRSKPSNQKPYGLLNPLSIPSKPWESIGIDFIGPLLLSSN